MAVVRSNRYKYGIMVWSYGQNYLVVRFFYWVVRFQSNVPASYCSVVEKVKTTANILRICNLKVLYILIVSKQIFPIFVELYPILSKIKHLIF